MKNKRVLFICMNGESRSRFFAEKFMKLGYMAMFAGYADNSFLIIQKGMFKWADEIVLLDKYWNKDNAMQYYIDYANENGKVVIEHYLEDEQIQFDKFCNNLLDTMKKQ